MTLAFDLLTSKLHYQLCMPYLREHFTTFHSKVRSPYHTGTPTDYTLEVSTGHVACRPGWAGCRNKIISKTAHIGNVTGRHRAPKWKASAWLQSTVTTMHVLPMRPAIMLHELYFSSLSVVSRAFSTMCTMCVLCVYSTFWHHH